MLDQGVKSNGVKNLSFKNGFWQVHTEDGRILPTLQSYGDNVTMIDERGKFIARFSRNPNGQTKWDKSLLYPALKRASPPSWTGRTILYEFTYRPALKQRKVVKNSSPLLDSIPKSLSSHDSQRKYP